MEMTKINCKALLDQCWAMLNRKYEEVHGVRNYGYESPEFEFILSAEEIRALRIYAAGKDIGAQEFMRIDKHRTMLFGHPLVEQQRTPYLTGRKTDADV